MIEVCGLQAGKYLAIQANALDIPLPDGSVDLIVTSPPYFALRTYTDGGKPLDGQVGAEETPQDFLDALIAATQEMVRVLKPTGSIWVNLGDKYVAKSLMGLPWRYAIRCIDELGLTLRAEVIWAKTNGLPESVTDRVKRQHETWFHFTLGGNYFADINPLREPHKYPNDKRAERTVTYEKTMTAHIKSGLNPLGKIPGSYWLVSTEPLRLPEDLRTQHFAAFPTEFPRRIILGWSPTHICADCGEGQKPITKVYRNGDCSSRRHSDRGHGTPQGNNREPGMFVVEGYRCGCDVPSGEVRPAVVLDPFGGTGTTAHIAAALGRTGISLDLSADYTRVAQDERVAQKRAEKVRKRSRT